MFSVGKIAGGFVAEVTGNEDLGQLVGLGVDLYMGNYVGAAEQFRGLDLGGGNAFANEPGHDSYDYDAGGWDSFDDGYSASEYLDDQRATDETYSWARETDDWSEEQWESDLQTTLDEGEALLAETAELEDGIEDLADFEADERVADDNLRANQRV